MRLARYNVAGRPGIAAADAGEDFHGLFADQTDYPGGLDSLLARGADLVVVGERLLAAPKVDLNSAALDPPVARPSKIICLGLNYLAHAEEIGYKPAPDYPTIFARFPSTLIGHGAPLIRPSQSDQFDYEGELAVVIGRAGRNISSAVALDHVAGYSIFNDASVRDYQNRTSQWTMGKNFDSTGPFGPWLVTPDELPLGDKGLTVTTRLNGTEVQSGNTNQMIFDVAAQITILSEAMTLLPGDVIVTGTPAGVGMSRQPQLWMKPGDECVIEIERIGILKNKVNNA
jgi:2-keto-4-pentenoate hydratase/2-oxohepta-3-ene-1,7-dioic acid hydratase in catechol pathway